MLISYCWQCLWGDSVFESPSFQVHLLGKSGRIHFLSVVPSEPFSVCSTFTFFKWWPFVSFTGSVPFTLNLCAALPFKTASVFSLASPLMPDSPFAAFVRNLAACGQMGPVPTDSDLDGTDGIVYLRGNIKCHWPGFSLHSSTITQWTGINFIWKHYSTPPS